MKRLKINRNYLLFPVLMISFAAMSQGQNTVEKTPVLNLRYFCLNDKVPYLLVESKWKSGKKYEPAKNIVVNLYLDKDSISNLMAKVTTNDNGVAKVIIPAALKPVWDNSATHTFLGKAEANKEFVETTTEITITKTKITIDTISDGEIKNITVIVSALLGDEWLPAKDIEMKIGIKRQGSILSAGDEETYTTDSTGTATVEFNKDSLPGDEKGNIVLVAMIDNNDQYGTLQTEKTVTWGNAFKPDTTFFNHRSLWSTRSRTPFWLLFMAYSIILIVWGTLIYLIVQFFKIKKMGTSSISKRFLQNRNL